MEKKLTDTEPLNVFKYFEEISSIPRGSGNMDKISDYCVNFAKSLNLKYIQDKFKNVIIFKEGTKGYENSKAVILQGHLDMVCQKDNGVSFDFEKEGLNLFVEDGFVKARGTTLGADNGIAVAMMLAILESDDISHPPIEAVFTTDEEIGMVGAVNMDLSPLKGKTLINIDSEDPSVITASCAGGSDFKIDIPVNRYEKEGTKIKISVKGLKGGHSGVEIHKGRLNANILTAGFLNKIKNDISVIGINGGDKGNAIPLYCSAEFVTENPQKVIDALKAYETIVKEENSSREEKLALEVEVLEQGKHNVLTEEIKNRLLFFLMFSPNGVINMSCEIEGLVETSLNLGILKTTENAIEMLYALRSNKESALKILEEKLELYSQSFDCTVTKSGHYPPWEFKTNSRLREVYAKKYTEKTGKAIKIAAIHAGLECGVFSSGIYGIDCISVGPLMYDIHTTKERLSVSSTGEIYEIIINVLKCLK